MAGLQVFNAPANQPTLNPRVQSAPVGPTLAPRVTQPQQPTIAPRVVTQPQQPSFNPVVQSQPQGQQPTLPVSYGGVIDSILAAKARGADAQNILQAIISQNQEKAPVFQEALSRGASAEQILDKIIQDNYIKSDQAPEGERGLKGVALGVAKGAFGTLKNIAKFGSRVFVPGAAPFVKASLNTLIPNENLEAHGTAEKIGKVGENIAEFFISGGAVGKIGKAAEAGVDALKFGSKTTGLLKLGTKAAIGVGEAAGVTALQGGSKDDVKHAAEFGAGFSVVAKGIEKVIQKLPETAWTTILKRTPTEAAKNPDLPAQAAKTGLAGTSKKVILEKSQQAIQAIETTLDDLLSKSKGTVNTAKVAGYLGDLRNSYAVIPGEKASVDAIDNIASELYQGFKEGKALSLVEANQLKRNIYNIIAKSYGKGAWEIPAKTEAQKLIAAGLKREIEKVIPEVKALNQKQAVYLQVKKAIEKSIARTEGKGIAGSGVRLYDLLVGGIGTGAGLATGNPLLGIGLVAAKKTGESTALLSSVSKLINYFNQLSPTKKLLFYNALKGLTVKSGVGITQQTAK